jgi:hypothetical protein
LFDELFDFSTICRESHFKDVLNCACKEHPVRIPPHYQDATDVDGVTKATDVASKVEDGIDFPFILNHSIGEPDIALKVCCRVYGADVLAVCMAYRQEVIVVRLVLVPNPELRVFQLDFVEV